MRKLKWGGLGRRRFFRAARAKVCLVHLWGVVIRLFAAGGWCQTVLVYLVVAVSRSEVP